MPFTALKARSAMASNRLNSLAFSVGQRCYYKTWIDMPLKTLFLNPPSFENFDGGASSRWPATREIESYWYPVWLAYPTGMLEGARLLDAPPHHISAEQTIEIAKDYEFMVLFTSTPGFPGDIGCRGRSRRRILGSRLRLWVCT